MACYDCLLLHCKLHFMGVLMAAPLRLSRRVLGMVLVYALPLAFPLSAVRCFRVDFL